MTKQTSTQVLVLALPWRWEYATRTVAVAILLSLLLHVVILSVVFTVRWWVQPIVPSTMQAFNVSLVLNPIAPDKIPSTDVLEPVPQSDIPPRRVNPAIGFSPVVEDKVEPELDNSEKNQHATPSDNDNSISVVEKPLPSIDLDAALSIAREVGRMPQTEARTPDVYGDGGVLTKSEKMRLAVERAWSPPPSCYRAYSGMGLFAIPFLLKDTVTSDGCEW